MLALLIINTIILTVVAIGTFIKNTESEKQLQRLQKESKERKQAVMQNFAEIKNQHFFEPMKHKFDQLGAYRITLIQRPTSKHWRLWLNWRSEYNYLYLCEYPTIDECLDSAIDFISKK